MDPLAIASIGSSAVGSILNPILQARENKKNREYNKPINQMARLKEAGLNPHLVYGNGANAQMPSQQAPQVDASAPMQMLQAYQNYTLQSIEKDKINAQIDLIRTQERLAAAGIPNKEADTRNKGLHYSMQSGLFPGQLTMQQLKLRGQDIANEGGILKNQGQFTKNETMRIMQQPTLQKMIAETLLLQEKKSLIPYEKDLIRNKIENLDSSTALNEVKKLGQEKQNVIMMDTQALIITQQKVQQGIITKNEAEEQLTRTRERWMSAGLSPTATQDLIEMFIPWAGKKKLINSAQQDQEWMRRGRQRFEEIRRANQNKNQ